MGVKSIVGLVAVIFGISSAAQAQRVPAASSCNLPQPQGIHEQRLLSGKLERTYRLFVPPSYDGHTPLALVLELHGSGGTAAGQARTSGFDAIASREGFAVASLQADGGRWNVPVQK